MRSIVKPYRECRAIPYIRGEDVCEKMPKIPSKEIKAEKLLSRRTNVVIYRALRCAFISYKSIVSPRCVGEASHKIVVTRDALRMSSKMAAKAIA